ncbi:hypothetical protein AMK59_4531 [Oryctes borbonicus]|uniref:Uncharacterized protein n=1 Tax=Oryctes borbonicus TaxID=1629725 RepID=A0A0T6B7Q7_9SCAR|nr:hypothetical protein AMK59_4531 [Oryctes borbonicus]
MEYVYVILVALAVFKTAESLHCWKCQSRDDGECTDYFNATKHRIRPRLYQPIDTQIPSEENCETYLGFQITNQKPVCMKRVEIVHGRKHYTRKCEFIHVDLSVGECLQQVSEDPHVKQEYCQYCDSDFCNGTDPLKTRYWIALASIISFLLLRFLH